MSLSLFGLGLGWSLSYVAATSDSSTTPRSRSAAASSASPTCSRASPARPSRSSAGSPTTASVSKRSPSARRSPSGCRRAHRARRVGRRASRPRAGRASCRTRRELVVVADVVGRVVRMGREHEQDGVSGRAEGRMEVRGPPSRSSRLRSVSSGRREAGDAQGLLPVATYAIANAYDIRSGFGTEGAVRRSALIHPPPAGAESAAFYVT